MNDPQQRHVVELPTISMVLGPLPADQRETAAKVLFMCRKAVLASGAAVKMGAWTDDPYIVLTETSYNELLKLVDNPPELNERMKAAIQSARDGKFTIETGPVNAESDSQSDGASQNSQ